HRRAAAGRRPAHAALAQPEPTNARGRHGAEHPRWRGSGGVDRIPAIRNQREMSMRKPVLTVVAIAALVSFGSIRRAAADEVGELYVKKCASCHGRDGKGNTVMGKKLTIRDLTDAANM